MKKIIVLILCLIIMTGCMPESKHEDATFYQNGKCVAFYPLNNERIEEYAKSLCEDPKERKHIDYEIEEVGEFLKVIYPDRYFYTGKYYEEIELEVKDHVDILANYLRYRMKKDDLDIAYTSQFILDTNEDTLDVSDVKISFLEDGILHFYFPQFDYDLIMSLDYAQQIVKRDFGVEDKVYEKRRYLNDQRPMIAITYDDGPFPPVDEDIYETMEKYDARCTFYIVGDRLSPSYLESVEKAISYGHEIGSHSENHQFLSKCSAEEAMGYLKMVNDYVEEKLGYEIKTYRPPYGARNLEMEEIIDMPCIMWNVDSKDWKYRDEDETYDRIMSVVNPDDVILMHALYYSTGRATRRLVPDLIDKGYQLVTISELLEHLNFTGKYFEGQ
jgi:peptidoglycan/xylan/chitin deacetylase (PgdA/CDA1 family)